MLCVHGTLSRNHRNEHPKIPQLLASLPPALRIKLPKDFLQSYGIMTLPRASNHVQSCRVKVPTQNVKMFMAESCSATVEHCEREEDSSTLAESRIHCESKKLAIPLSIVSDTEASLATYIACKKALEPADIMDRGVDTDPQPLGQYGKAFSLIHGRPVCFVVDPHADLIRMLRGSSRVDGVHVAWAALSERMGLAQTRLKQYEQDYRTQKNEAMTCKSSCPMSALPRTRLSPPTLAICATSRPILRTHTPKPKCESQSALLRSVAADPPERSTSAAGPSVKTLVAKIETALALEHGTRTPDSESVPRAQPVGSTLVDSLQYFFPLRQLAVRAHLLLLLLSSIKMLRSSLGSLELHRGSCNRSPTPALVSSTEYSASPPPERSSFLAIAGAAFEAGAAQRASTFARNNAEQFG
ncbi:hypothetical protein B0H13DRAFT_2106475 [Mycena leptocephala]|nr:hypothetical protein B0H13DRAFT_2106475 [Mycena leptocephala]